MKENIISRILRNDLCAGCGICEAIVGIDVINVRIDDEGYFRPHVLSDIPRNASRIIEGVCPAVTVINNFVDEAADIDPVWGPLIKIRSGFSADPDIRFIGSSGGAITAMAVHLLDAGIVDYVVQVGADRDKPLDNVVVLSKTREDIIGCAGSRYAPSSPLREISEILDRPGKFAFIGKPCDVSALRRYSAYNSAVQDKVALYISFMCAGVPSMHGTYKLLNRLDTEIDDVASFRYRGEGWPGCARVVRTDGTERHMSYNESWGGILNRFLQFRCKICPDGIGEFADVVCADAWECDRQGYPKFSEAQGASLLISRTQRGEEFIRRCIGSGALKIDRDVVEVGEVNNMQPHQFKRKTALAARYLAMKVCGRMAPKVARARLVQLARLQSATDFLKSFFGTVRRIMKGSRAGVGHAGK